MTARNGSAIAASPPPVTDICNKQMRDNEPTTEGSQLLSYTLMETVMAGVFQEKTFVSPTSATKLSSKEPNVDGIKNLLDGPGTSSLHAKEDKEARKESTMRKQASSDKEGPQEGTKVRRIPRKLASMEANKSTTGSINSHRPLHKTKSSDHRSALDAGSSGKNGHESLGAILGNSASSASAMEDADKSCTTWSRFLDNVSIDTNGTQENPNTQRPESILSGERNRENEDDQGTDDVLIPQRVSGTQAESKNAEGPRKCISGSRSTRAGISSPVGDAPKKRISGSRSVRTIDVSSEGGAPRNCVSGSRSSRALDLSPEGDAPRKRISGSRSPRPMTIKDDSRKRISDSGYRSPWPPSNSMDGSSRRMHGSRSPHSKFAEMDSSSRRQSPRPSPMSARTKSSRQVSPRPTAAMTRARSARIPGLDISTSPELSPYSRERRKVSSGDLDESESAVERQMEERSRRRPTRGRRMRRTESAGIKTAGKVEPRPDRAQSLQRRRQISKATSGLSSAQSAGLPSCRLRRGISSSDLSPGRSSFGTPRSSFGSPTPPRLTRGMSDPVPLPPGLFRGTSEPLKDSLDQFERDAGMSMSATDRRRQRRMVSPVREPSIRVVKGKSPRRGRTNGCGVLQNQMAQTLETPAFPNPLADEYSDIDCYGSETVPNSDLERPTKTSQTVKQALTKSQASKEGGTKEDGWSLMSTGFLSVPKTRNGGGGDRRGSTAKTTLEMIGKVMGTKSTGATMDMNGWLQDSFHTKQKLQPAMGSVMRTNEDLLEHSD